MKKVSRAWLIAPVALAAMLAVTPTMAQSGRQSAPSLWTGGASPVGAIPNTANTSSPANWRLTAGSSFNGVTGAFDGTALLLFTATGLSGTYACSGSLVSSQYVLTAGHCTDGLINMQVQFGYTNNVALQTRNVVSVVQAPGWNGTLDTGADLALVKLDAPVTNLPIYKLSTTNDLGKQYIMTGYGTSGTGSSNGSPTWNDGDYGHYGYNTFDTTSDTFEAAWDATTGEGVYTAPTYGHTYVTDFDFYNGTSAQETQYNTLQRIAGLTGGSWSSDQGLGATEALIAGGDSGAAATSSGTAISGCCRPSIRGAGNSVRAASAAVPRAAAPRATTRPATRRATATCRVRPRSTTTSTGSIRWSPCRNPAAMH